MIRASIRRPVAVAMAYASVAALGAFAWRNIPIELYPDTQLPRLTVSARWGGASPETVEAFLTSPLESTIQKVRGVEKIVSDSEEGRAEISVEFARGTDMEFARLELAERISTVEEDLPPNVDDVVVEQFVPREFEGQNEALLRYEFTGPYTQEALYRFLEDVVIPELGQVEGVSLVRAYGGRQRLLEIRVDERKATAFGLSPFQIGAAIRNLDLVREAGAVREGDREWTITIVNRARGLEDVRDAVVAHRSGSPVRLSDVATVHDSFEEARSYSRIDGRPSLNFVVLKETGANAVRVADAVKARVERLERLSPYGSRFILNERSDQSREIRAQLSDLRFRAIVAAGVIFGVLLLFLRSFRSAGMVFATIAFSVLIALNLIYFGGLSLNLLTLMGLAMGFGLIVDNSIVVLENVYRRWQGGEDPADAAEGGTREVVLPILASTATTLIVFVPFVYLQGELRLYYVPLAVVVVLTLLSSLFVAFTFIPAVSSRILAVAGPVRRGFTVAVGAVRPGDAVSGAARAPGAVPAGGSASAEGDGPGARPASRRPPLYVRFYEALVGFTLRHPWLTVVVTAACLGGSYYLFDKHVATGVVWGGWGGRDDTRITITTRLPRGSNLDRSDQLARFFEEKLVALPEVEQFTTQVQETSSFIEVTFPDSLELTAVPVAIKDLMFAYSLTFTGADVRVQGFGPSFYGGGGSPPMYHVQVMGYNYEQVRVIAEDIGRRLERFSRIHQVDTNSSSRWYNRDRAVEYTLRIDRTALARHDLTVQDLTQRIQAFVASSASRAPVKVADDEVLLEVKVRAGDGLDVLALREALLPGVAGRGAIRLGDVVTVEPREVLSSIHRENQQYHRTVAYEFRGPQKLGDVYRDAVIETMTVPPGYTVQTQDRWRWSSEEQAQMWLVLLVSIVLVYMVTSALVESLLQPLCVLLAVPMALIGVFMIFFYSGATFTREAWIGVIMMGGIVVNGAILLVDHVNRIRATRPDLSFEDAILRGTLERVRPILMTAATTVLGLLPLVLFSESANANIWNALGFALIGGLLSSTLFTLTTTPALYAILVGPKARRDAWRERHRAGSSTRPAGAPAAALALATALFTLGCGDAGPGDGAGSAGDLLVSVDTVDGVPIVRTSGPLPSWSLTDAVELGSVGGAGERADDEFGTVTSVTVGPDDRLWVADATNAEIRVFGRDGALERVVGRQGQGPGEFGSLYSVAWAGDRLLALDFGNGRMAELSPEGEWLGSRPAPGRITGSASMLRLYPVGPKEVYMWSLRTDPAFQRVWVRHGPEGEEGAFPQPDVQAAAAQNVRCEGAGGTGIGFTSNPWAPSGFQHPAPGGRLWIGTSERYRLALVDTLGDTVRVVERDVPRVPLSDEEWESADADHREFRESWKGADCTGDWARPEHKPAFRNVLVDTSGRLWVERMTREGTAWEVFDRDGMALGTVPGFEYSDRTAPHLSDRHVAWVTRDVDLGISRVHWRRLRADPSG